MVDHKFRAFVVEKKEEEFSAGIKEMNLEDLPQGEVVIKVEYSSINYKDGLASIPNGKIVQSYPFIPGIDLAGIVITSEDARYQAGDSVIITGYDLGVTHFGGFSEYARVPADWIVPLPDGLSLKEAMTIGTAGFTAALAIQRLEENGVKPENGSVLVTGASGGVGSMAIAMLSQLGYEVVASTGKEEEHDYLRRLGAKEILSREQVSPEKIRAIDKQQWAGAIDSVGGNTLAYVLSTAKYGASVAACGLTGGVNLPTSVFPFILRGVNLLGIDSVYCPSEVRLPLWKRIATELKPKLLHEIATEITLEDLPQTLDAILKGKVRGRTVVKISK